MHFSQQIPNLLWESAEVAGPRRRCADNDFSRARKDKNGTHLVSFTWNNAASRFKAWLLQTPVGY